MDGVDILEPLRKSHTANELEYALQQAFMQTYIDILGADIKDIFDYSAPHLANLSVIERFSKQHGLVVLRRPATSEKLMQVIYSTWISLGSKRGLSFLNFVLRMLYPNQYSIKRLYHPKALANEYPLRLSYQNSPDSFLTSRIHVSLKAGVDMKELAELAPTLVKLVPANIVPSVSIEIEQSNIEIVGAVGMQAIHVANLEPFTLEI